MHQQTKRDLISFLGYILCCLSICLTYLAPVFNKEWFEDIAEVKDIKLFPVGADDWLGISSAEYDSHCGDAIGGRTLIEALDGTDYWKHLDNEDHWFILDLGQTYTIKKVRSRSNTFYDPTDVDVFVSDSKESWGTAVAEGITTWQDTDDWVEVDSTDKDGRYIKVEVYDCESAPYYYLYWGKDVSFTIFDAYGDVAGEPSKNWVERYSYWFTGGNLTVDYIEQYSYWYTGGNLTVDYIEQYSYWFSGGNISVDWNERYSYWYTGGNISNYEERYDYWFSGGNISVDWNERYNYWFTGGNILAWIEEYNYWYPGGNISTYEEKYSYWFTGGNASTGSTLGIPNPANNSNVTQTSLTWSISINNTFGTFNWTINCSNGQNNSANNDNNGTKTLNLSNLQYQTYIIWLNITDQNGIEHYWFQFTVIPGIITGSFRYSIDEQRVTLYPTLSDSVDYYRFIIENGYKGVTNWIPKDDIYNHICFLHYGKRYKITMQYKNETLLKWFTETINMPNPPPAEKPEIEEPVEIVDDIKPRRNIFEGIPEAITNWWNNRNNLEKLLVIIPIIIIPLILVSRRKQIRKYYHIKKKKKEEGEENK